MQKLSIILPVYNCEKYLNKCIDSVLAQTAEDWELVLVDDGSADGSGAVCDAYAEKDSRIRVIHQENGGVSSARNTGLDAAKGDFIGFLDADDWLEADMVEQVLLTLHTEKADALMFDPYVHNRDLGNISVDSMHFFPESIRLQKTDISPEKLRFFAGTVWRCVYRKDILETHKIRYDVRLPLSEDRIFNLTAMGCCETIYYLRKPLYHYWIHPGSAVGKYRENMLDVVLDTHRIMAEVLNTYWGAEYLPVYERVNLVDGALLCVYNAFSKRSKASFKQRYNTVRAAVNNQDIHIAVSRMKKRNLRQWLLLHKCCAGLCAVGWLWNVKNG